MQRDKNIQHLWKYENFAAFKDGSIIVLCWDCGMKDTNTELVSYHYQQAQCARCNARNAPNG
jgi:uncharacterized paraquat-inducible protein A